MSPNRLFLASTTKMLLLSLIIPVTACQRSPEPEPALRTFASPEEAGAALAAAAKSGDQNAIPVIFGPGSKDVVLSGDAVADKNAADGFAGRYGVMHRWRKMPDGSLMLVVGADNFPFAIPLKKNDAGQWFFDLAAGKDEMLSRRIGQNELSTIDTCEALADAEADYFTQVHDGETTKQYAVKFISDPGKQNGLYWKPATGQPESPLGPAAAFAAAEGYKANPNSHTAFHGYYFKMLTSQSDKAPGGAKDYLVNGKMVAGFALVAYPAVYGNSGVMTFIMNQDGVVLQKDLGKNTTDIATAMSTFDPSSGWTPAEE
jgi:Protein of unknown function (DUF2950)